MTFSDHWNRSENNESFVYKVGKGRCCGVLLMENADTFLAINEKRASPLEQRKNKE